MAFFDDISKKIEDLTQTAAKKSSEVLEFTKLTLNIHAEEENIRKLYNKIGILCYEIFENGLEDYSSVTEICEQVKVHKDKIKELKKEIDKAKNIKSCSNCGTELEETHMYCPKCGTKVEFEEEVKEEIEEDVISEEKEEEIVVEVIICPKCSTELKGEYEFCTNCGEKLK